MNSLNDSNTYIFDMDNDPLSFTPLINDNIFKFHDSTVFINAKEVILDKFGEVKLSNSLNQEYIGLCQEINTRQNSMPQHTCCIDFSAIKPRSAKTLSDDLTKTTFIKHSSTSSIKENDEF
jgi:hypothetical protein